MSVKIRLRRMGAKGQPSYRVVVTDSRQPRDGRFIETIGYYNPRRQPADIRFDEVKALAWLARGAEPSDTARALLRKGGIWARFTAEGRVPPAQRQAATARRERAAGRRKERRAQARAAGAPARGARKAASRPAAKRAASKPKTARAGGKAKAAKAKAEGGKKKDAKS